MHSIASNMVAIHMYMYLCLESCLIVNVNITICAGARIDIEDEDGETALQRAEEKLADEDDPERRQCFEKVHKDTHTVHCHTLTVTHFHIPNGC